MNWWLSGQVLPEEGQLVLVWSGRKGFLARRFKTYWHVDTIGNTVLLNKTDHWALITAPSVI